MDQQIAVTEQKSLFMTKAQEQMEIAKRLVINGKKLADDEVRALAVYTAQTGLNISLNECYYMPGTGPVPGIAGIRRLAKESAILEANEAKYRLVGKGYRLEFIQATEDKKIEGSYNLKNGDIAYECILTSDMDEAFWLNKLFPVIEKLSGYGLSYPEAREQAAQLVGDCPRTSYVGVVFGSEAFAFAGKPEKMDRHERAKKRAEKGALKKRFALQINVSLDEPDEFIQMEVSKNNDPIFSFEDPSEKKPLKELISSLGFEDDDSNNTDIHDAVFENFVQEEERSPNSPEATLEFINTEAAKWQNKKISDGKKGLIAPVLETCFASGNATSKRHQVLKYLTGHASITEIPDNYLIALYTWLKPVKDSGGAWMPLDEAAKQAQQIIAFLDSNDDQMELPEFSEPEFLQEEA